MGSKPHIFVDNQLSPELASWIGRSFGVPCTHIRSVRPRIKEDAELLRAAAIPGGIILSKDEDFARLARTRAPPPDVVWLRCGNRSDAKLRVILDAHLGRALDMIKSGERVVEIRDADAHCARRRR